MRALILSSVLAITATMAPAAEPNAVVQDFLETQILPWAQDTVIVDAIIAQNAETGGLNASDIDALDQTWRAAVGTGTSDMVEGVLTGPAADFLRTQMGAAGGMITEVFVMDAQGLNVAASGPTSDYWQGDEAKFQETYLVGPNAVHVSEVEFDESSQSFSVQVSITLQDPASGDAIGAMTVGVDAEALM